MDMQVEADDLVVTLEGIVEKFGEEIAPYAVGLCQHLTSAFYRTLQVQLPDGLECSRVLDARPHCSSSDM